MKYTDICCHSAEIPCIFLVLRFYQPVVVNNEATLLNFTHALKENILYCYIFKDRDLNSHVPMREVYERMLEAWRKLGEPYNPISPQEIQTIIAARRYPDA